MTKVILLLGVVVAVGKLFDLLSLREEKHFQNKRISTLVIRLGKKPFQGNSEFLLEKYIRFLEWLLLPKGKLWPIVRFLLISWLLTSVAFLLSYFIDPKLFLSTKTYWHDYLPWYPIYIMNFVIDYLTFFATLVILKNLVGKNEIIKLLGYTFDLFIAYTLFSVCYFVTPKIQDFFDDLDSYTNVSTREIRDELKFNEKIDSIPLNLWSFHASGLDETFYDKLKRDSFSSKAFVFYEGRRETKEIEEFVLKSLLNPRRALSVFMLREDSFENDDASFVVKEETRIEVYQGRGYFKADPSLFCVSVTSLFPTYLYVSILIVLLLSALVYKAGRIFLYRVFKTAIKEDEEIEKFSIGTHIGLVVSLIIAILKFLSEL